MKAKLLSALLAATTLVACDQASPSADSADAGPGGTPSSAVAPASRTKSAVVARVNGVPITEAELEVKLAGGQSHDGLGGPDRRKTAIEQLVTREILAQEAARRGLDREPKYQEGLLRLEAQVAAYKRQELSALLVEREGEKRATPTEADARAYFAQHEKQIRTKVHVLQILRRSEAAIAEVRGNIERGKTFEEAARDLLPNLPEGQAPWDLGYLAFYKVPEPWRETVYDMKPGEMSGILRGPNERFWLVKLVDVKEDPSITFESVRDALLTDMKANKLQRSREDIEREQRAGAKVELY